jgi:hypothetical protein
LWLWPWDVRWGVETLEMKCTWTAIVIREEDASTFL